MGSGPLLYLVAAQYVKAGAQVAAVLDTSTVRCSASRALPRLLAIPAALKKGVALIARIEEGGRADLSRRARPHRNQGFARRTAVTRRSKSALAERQEHRSSAATPLRSAITCAPRRSSRISPAAEFIFDDAAQQWLPANRRAMAAAASRASISRGDGARVRGADAAERSGRLAALAALKDARRTTGGHRRYAAFARRTRALHALCRGLA